MALFDRSRRRTSPAANGSEPDVPGESSRQQALTHNGHHHCARCTAWATAALVRNYAPRQENCAFASPRPEKSQRDKCAKSCASGGVLDWTVIGLAVLAIVLLVAQIAQAEDKLAGESFRDLLTDGQPCPDCPEMMVIP